MGIAARVAARLREGGEARVELKRGGIGELRVEVDGRDLYDGNRLWYSAPSRIVAEVRGKMRA